MTVPSTTNRISYATGGGVTSFAYPFKVFDEDDLTVILRDSSGSETALAITTDYTVSGAGEDAGGNVTTVATYAAGYTLVIKRELDILQETDYIEGSAFNAGSHEDALDKLTMIAQQLDEELDRSLKVAVSSSQSDLEVPDPTALQYLRWNSAGSGLENAELTALGDLTAHENAATPHMQGGWYADNDATGPVILATAAEVAAGNDASKVLTPAGFAAVWQYDEYFVPAGAFVPAETNGATIDTQEYPVSGTNVDYAEFGASLDEEAVCFAVALSRTWDQATIKAKPIWMASYNRALSNGASVVFGFQARAWNDGSPIDTNYATPPAYVTDTVTNTATGTRFVGDASANFATAIAGSDNLLEIRVTRKNAGTTGNANGPVWLAGVIVQIKRLAQAVGW